MKKLNKKITSILSCVLVIMFGVMVFVMAQEKKPAKKFKLIQKKNFSKNVKNFSFPKYISLELSKKYPDVKKHGYTIITDNSAQFYDKQGNLTKEIIKSKYQEFFTSENGLFVALVEYISDYEWYWTVPAKKVTLYNFKGDILWIKNDVPAIELFISNDGECTVGYSIRTSGNYHPYSPKLNFYDGSGNLLKTYGITPNRDGTKFSPEGKFVVVIGQVPKINKESKREYDNYIFLFDNKGNEIWRHKDKYTIHFNSVDISYDGRYICGGSEYRPDGKKYFYFFKVYNKRGSQISQYNFSDYRKVTLSSDGKMLLFSTIGDIHAYNPLTGSKLWEKKLKGITYIDIAEETKEVVVTQGNHVGENTYFSEITLLSDKGEVLFHHVFPESFVHGLYSSARFSKNGKLIIHHAGSNIHILQVEKTK
jgi:hypothetical protein